ncbi:MAG: hypothetical protein KBA31_13060 [Alphaproteobacteria bacterium]|nr:hypothetical protein [Alphaproteobacteria bacterium]
MTSTPESIHNLDEAKVLGYFESMRSVFLVKMATAALLSDKTKPNNQIFRQLLASAGEEIGVWAEDPLTPIALKRGNEEVHLNLFEDAVSGLMLSAWSIFEQVIKDLAHPNYAGDLEKYSVEFERRMFGFTHAEKDDIAFFYYLRNCIAHYNGAYNAYKSIDHTYLGHQFKSVGHEGNQIDIDPKLLPSICRDLERYTLRAWNAVKSPAPGSTGP